jgi:hypothetical protein
MPTTKKTTTKPEPGNTLKEVRESMLADAESVIRQALEEERGLTLEERSLLFDSLQWDQHRIRKEKLRLAAVRRHQQVAGTSKDREAAIKHRDACVKANRERGAELRETIEQIERELHKLQADENLAVQRVQQMQSSVASLRKLAPPHLLEELNAKRQMVKAAYHQPTSEAEIELHHAMVLTDPSMSKTPDDYLSTLRSHNEKWVVRHPRSQRLEITPEGEAGIKALKAELPVLRKNAEELRAEFDSELAKYPLTCDIYLR